MTQISSFLASYDMRLGKPLPRYIQVSTVETRVLSARSGHYPGSTPTNHLQCHQFDMVEEG